ncbi:MAG: hypothetical protein LH613_17810, partial [Chamaesiphon sp.]|nr:hypothetical protein [Chamaesiphon sp.]
PRWISIVTVADYWLCWRKVMSSGDRSVATVIPIATAKDIRTLQRLKPPLVMKSPPTRIIKKTS